MKKILVYVLSLLFIASCGSTPSESYLKVVSTSHLDINTSSTITIVFNEEMEKVNMVLKNRDEIQGKVAGTSEVIGKKFIFKSKNKLKLASYQVTIYKAKTISSNKKTLKDDYRYTFKTKIDIVNIDETLPALDSNTSNLETVDNTTNNQSYNTCSLIPQMDCSDIKQLKQN